MARSASAIPNLKPETSNTLTLGLVLSPGGWAQGMRFSVDYYNIQVKDGIGTSFSNSESRAGACWEPRAATMAAQYFEGSDGRSHGHQRPVRPEQLEPARNPFANFADANGNPIAGSRNLQDIVSYNASRPSNRLPYQRRGIDLSLSYCSRLSRAFESLPGTLSLTDRAQRALEASGLQVNSNASGFYDQTAAGVPVPNGTESPSMARTAQLALSHDQSGRLRCQV